MPKYRHELRDPVHQFIVVSNDERGVIDSSPVQRLREIHQLALSYLVYPGATHRRFEHSLGVMELGGQIYDALFGQSLDEEIRETVPEVNEAQTVAYGRQVVRLAGLLHDIGHLPFSHAAEVDLLPTDRRHEHITVDLILSEEIRSLLEGMLPPVNPDLVAKVAVGPKRWGGERFSTWEALLSDIITSDVFGADRMDYLLRDSLHTGVAYGRFDLHRLVQSLRILSPSPAEEGEGPASPVIGLDEGGLHSAEALLLARYFMFSQVYFHPIRQIYDQHLLDFLGAWLPNGQYPEDTASHLQMTDSEVLAGMRTATRDTQAAGHDPARRVVRRDHFRRLYEPTPGDAERHLDPTGAVADWATSRYGDVQVRRVSSSKAPGAVDFPVRLFDGRVGWSLGTSQALRSVPSATYDGVFIHEGLRDEASRALQQDRDEIFASRAGRQDDE